MLSVVRLKLEELIRKRKLDEGHGVSNRELARRIGISHVALFKMRKGMPYNPTLAMLDILCKFFDCKVQDIIEFGK